MKATTLEDYKERILRVMLYIQDNLDSELSLSELAEVAHFCYEVYLNDPEATEPEELLTDIYAPIEPK